MIILRDKFKEIGKLQDILCSWIERCQFSSDLCNGILKIIWILDARTWTDLKGSMLDKKKKKQRFYTV